MPFKDVLGRIVHAAGDGIGAALVDGEGETIDLFTTGDVFHLRLAGAHQGIILSLLNDVQKRIGKGETVKEISVRSDLYTYTVAHVEDDILAILVQGSKGIPSMGMKALRDGLPAIRELI